jgi:hypothetical protein
MAAIPLLGMVAFSVDYGYLLKARTDLQRAADAAALAAAQSLVPDVGTLPDECTIRAIVRSYAAANAGNRFTVLDADIEIGRFEPSTIYSKVVITRTGTYFDTVRVTLRRDGVSNPRAQLFFAKAIGFGEATITATATAALQKASGLKAGSDVLPFAVPLYEWEMQDQGDKWSIYGDGRILDDWGAEVPGNWGTVDVGLGNNSTDDLSDQIINGLRQYDIDALYADGIIDNNEYIGAFTAMWLGADTGLSSGMKDDLRAIVGQKRLIPIYRQLNDEGGNNMAAEIVRWGVVKVTDTHFHGSKDTYVEIQKSHTYDADLRAHPRLDKDGDNDVIEGAFTSPVLLE